MEQNYETSTQDDLTQLQFSFCEQDAEPRFRSLDEKLVPSASASNLRLLATELAPGVSEPGPRLLGPEDSGPIVAGLIGRMDREHFVVLHLDTRHRIRATETVSIGSLSASLVAPREVFKAAILANSQAIVCGHNHPSGVLDPSEEDMKSFRRLREAGELLGIKVLDFLIVSGNEHRSISESGTDNVARWLNEM